MTSLSVTKIEVEVGSSSRSIEGEKRTAEAWTRNGAEDNILCNGNPNPGGRGGSPASRREH